MKKLILIMMIIASPIGYSSVLGKFVSKLTSSGIGLVENTLEQVVRGQKFGAGSAGVMSYMDDLFKKKSLHIVAQHSEDFKFVDALDQYFRVMPSNGFFDRITASTDSNTFLKDHLQNVVTNLRRENACGGVNCKLIYGISDDFDVDTYLNKVKNEVWDDANIQNKLPLSLRKSSDDLVGGVADSSENALNGNSLEDIFSCKK